MPPLPRTRDVRVRTPAALRQLRSEVERGLVRLADERAALGRGWDAIQHDASPAEADAYCRDDAVIVEKDRKLVALLASIDERLERADSRAFVPDPARGA